MYNRYYLLAACLRNRLSLFPSNTSSWTTEIPVIRRLKSYQGAPRAAPGHIRLDPFDCCQKNHSSASCSRTTPGQAFACRREESQLETKRADSRLLLFAGARRAHHITARGHPGAKGEPGARSKPSGWLHVRRCSWYSSSILSDFVSHKTAQTQINPSKTLTNQ